MAGDPAIENIDTKEICAGCTAFDRHETKLQRWRNFFRHTACVSFGRNSVLMRHVLNGHNKQAGLRF